eukprot:TRINITY_DN10510_c0_g1_i1.p1 TRINITY_DN10510_c0_g1~~TRINITY_DN10510_c0_g1_i1.p1  ORF type:complete len:338 (-),score=62.98 TRINITY_DN10510_c0_g1_i1:42-1055(-)
MWRQSQELDMTTPQISLHDGTVDMLIHLGISEIAQDIGFMDDHHSIPSLQGGHFTQDHTNTDTMEGSHFIHSSHVSMQTMPFSQMGDVNQEGQPLIAFPVYNHELQFGSLCDVEDKPVEGEPTDPLPTEQPSMKGKRKKRKTNKGLRLFSGKVCDIVEMKKTTTYNEVAEDLIKELNSGDEKVDGKNIKRRVYDALNVLTAMNIITKNKKVITWNGFPRPQELNHDANNGQIDRIQRKKRQLDDLSFKLTMYKSIIERNRKEGNLGDNRIYFPFIAIQTPGDTNVNCQISDDRTNYFFEFDQPFKIQEEGEVLRMLRIFQPNSLEDITNTNDLDINF